MMTVTVFIELDLNGTLWISFYVENVIRWTFVLRSLYVRRVDYPKNDIRLNIRICWNLGVYMRIYRFN